MHPLVHVIAVFAVISRLADIGTTYLVTPTLKLEANSLVRRFGWAYAWMTVLPAFITYVYPPFGIVLLTVSFLVAAFNASKIPMARVLGEAEMAALVRRVLLATPPWPGLLLLVSPAILVAMIAVCMFLFCPDPYEWGFYFAAGFVVFSVAISFWTAVRYFRIRREAAAPLEGDADELDEPLDDDDQATW
jgi:hypothetical protein